MWLKYFTLACVDKTHHNYARDGFFKESIVEWCRGEYGGSVRGVLVQSSTGLNLVVEVVVEVGFGS